MSKKRRNIQKNKPVGGHQPGTPRQVDSLLEHMQDGNEYGSIISLVPKPTVDIINDVIRGMSEIEKIRNRPCLAYVGNVVRNDDGTSGVDSTDDLPFVEMVNRIPLSEKKVDVVLATRGGSAHQISRFVNCLRSRFDEVDFILPSFCMSAGTLFALSGDKIWMTERACLGPIDPQVPTKDGRFVPAQALLLLVSQLQKEGQDAMSNGQSVPWTAVRIIDSIDKKELGDALTASNYSTTMATQFLANYKFQNWKVREGSGKEVDDQYRWQRANAIAGELASHGRWKSHGHAISREVLWSEIQLKIDHPDGDFERAILRLWALYNWLFDRTPILKTIISDSYRYIKHQTTQEKA